MLIEDIPPREFAQTLRGKGIQLVTGACVYHIRVDMPRLAAEIAAMYGAYPYSEPDGIADASVHITSLRAWPVPWRSRVKVLVDGHRQLESLPEYDPYAVFEAGLNWSIALSDIAPLLMHAAVVERDGAALLLPAPSGSGKSTLCAALCCSGWRLFSDEMAVFGRRDSWLLPNPRPVSLKNDAIAVIQARSSQACFSKTCTGGPKGRVAYMRAPRDAVSRCAEAAPARLVVQPVYRKAARLAVRTVQKVEAFRMLTDNAVNYASMLDTGFDTMTRIVDNAGFYEMTYSDLDEAMAEIARLHAEHRVA